MILDYNSNIDFQHLSVLLEESVNSLNIKPDGIYVDGTAGGAGHSSLIAKKLTTGRLIAIDKDSTAVEIATQRLGEFPAATVVQGDFKNIPRILEKLNIDKVDGIFLDLGVSSHQLDTPERGFSYRYDAPLDMRMDKDKPLTAYKIVNTYNHGQLARIFSQYGEERFSGSIAGKIVDAREEKPIETTFELVELIKAGIPAATRRTGGHPAKRVFQAIRIEVNGELDALEKCLDEAFDRLNNKGRFSVITFHSLEDRIVKQKFNQLAQGCTCPPDFPICVCGNKPKAKRITRKAIVPSEKELEVNNRSRSARLRVIEKIN